MVLVGGLLAGGVCLGFARGDVRFLRLGYWSLLVVSLPGWLIMRVGAEWIASKEGWTKKGVPTPTWLDIGFLLADLGGLILLVSLIVGGIGVRRLRGGGGAGLLRATLVLYSLVLASRPTSSPCGRWPADPAEPTSAQHRVSCGAARATGTGGSD